ncbi:MAG: NIL domain-containing protein [Dehalococcoidales bacterium]|nr:NIL domain-containing protein [Dehalococcoidales bacterium]
MAIVKKRMILIIPEEMLLEPVLYTINQQYDLKISIYNSDLIGNEGIMKLELEGEEKQIEEGLAWAMTRGIRVETAG